VVNDKVQYTSDHLWVRHVKDNLYRIGVTFDYLDRLAAVNIVELPKAGRTIKQGDSIAVLESSKAAIEISSPLTGIITKINVNVVSDPELVNRSPMEDGWLLEIEVNQLDRLDNLLSEEEYQRLL
jgi:glycine cleavage system H protein